MVKYQQYPSPKKRSGASDRAQNKSSQTGKQSERVTHNASHARGNNSGSYQAYVPANAKRDAAQYAQHGGDPNKKKKGGPWRVVFWGALVVFIGSLIALGVIFYGYWNQSKAYEDIADTAFEAQDLEGTSLEDMQVDWEALRAINPDTVGWVYIPGTVVNYPIVQTTDNSKYLKTDFSGVESWPSFGTIFLAAENTGDYSDSNNILYGHHMNDGSMFACIDDFTDENEFNSHRTIYVLTPEGNYKLTTFSLVICKGNDPLAQPNFSSAEEMIEYIEDKMNRSVVSPNSDIIAASDMKKIFALITCDYSVNDGRAVLFASVVDSTVGSEDGQDSNLINPEDAAIIEDATKEIQ